MHHVSARTRVVLLLCACAALALTGCGGANAPGASSTAGAGGAQAKQLPDSAYYLDPKLESWIDPDTGYDTTRTWKLEGGEWPIAVIMSPSQSPQALVGDRDGLFDEALKEQGITTSVEKIELPPRTFHALQRSKWPFVYMPLAVFTDYARSNDNQGGAGGLQYVLLAGSTAGGGYTLLAKDPAIKTVADLAGKRVGQANANPVPGTLLAAAAKKAGLELGEGKNQINLVRSTTGNQLDDFEAGKLDAVIALNITKAPLLAHGAHAVTDFSDVDYTPNYTVLAVERSVLEEKPEVVDAFLRAHYKANQIAEKEWDKGLKKELRESWNDYFDSQKGEAAKQRIAPSQAVFEAMLGNVGPEQRVDPLLVKDAFDFATANKLWGWDGTVDVSKLWALELYDKVLADNNEKPQAAASK